MARTSSEGTNKVYEIVSEKIIQALEEARTEGKPVPWRRPWRVKGGDGGDLPRSLSSGKAYRGINVFLLAISSAAAGYGSPWWGTYKQITERGGQVRKGERSTLVTFWGRAERWVTDEETGQRAKKPFFMLRYYSVFNLDQADPIDPAVPIKVPGARKAAVKVEDVIEPEPIEVAQAVVDGYASKLSGGFRLGGNRACYSPSLDQVNVPYLASFLSAEEYYSTVFHELGHSTGHKSRLNREGIVENHFFGDELYSKEELVAEMTAAMLCGVTGIEQVTLPNSVAYINNWLGALRKDPKLVVQAASQAQRAADLIQGIAWANEEPQNGEVANAA